MNRDEYLGRLRLSLEGDGFEQVEEAIAYFNELLEDRMAEEGLAEDLAVSALEPPEEAARQLVEGYHREEAQAEQAPLQGEQPAAQAGTADMAAGLRSYTIRADSVRDIRIRDFSMRLTIRGEDRADILLTHPESERVRYQFSLQEGRLLLEREKLPFHLQFGWFQEPRQEVILRLPREVAAGLDVRTSNAALSVEGFRCWGALQAATSNGKLTARALGARSLRLDTSNGAMNLDALDAWEGISARTSNGRVEAQNLTAPGFINLKTSNGRLQVSGLESERLSLRTSNGRIQGELPGAMADYTIASGTSNGKNSLPAAQPGGPKTLEAHTSNGAISLSFTLGAGTQKPDMQKEDPPRPKDLDESMARFAGQIERWGEQLAGKAEAAADWAENRVEAAFEEGRLEDTLDRFSDGMERFSEKLSKKAGQAADWAADKADSLAEEDGLEAAIERFARDMGRFGEEFAKRVERGVSGAMDRLDDTHNKQKEP